MRRFALAIFENDFADFVTNMKPPSSAPDPIDASPVRDIRLVMEYARMVAGHTFEATSLPGHLLQLMISGEVWQSCNGREYRLRAGDLIWYHEDELVQGRVLRAPWRLYSVNFIAPALPPPPFESRVYRRRGRLAPLFRRLRAAWRSAPGTPLVRKFHAHALLAHILAELAQPSQAPFGVDPRARLWWDLETLLRSDLRREIRLSDMARLSGKSPETIARACRLATGLPPMHRVRRMRLSLARGLLRSSALNVSEVADRVGYRRIHEFSRAYRSHYGHPPSADRRGADPSSAD